MEGGTDSKNFQRKRGKQRKLIEKRQEEHKGQVERRWRRQWPEKGGADRAAV